MGLGKTFAFLQAIKTTDSNFSLVVCPAYLKENWVAEAEKMGIFDIQVIRTRKDNYLGKALTIVGYDTKTIRNVLHQSLGFDIIGFDEAHYLRGRTAQRTKICLGTDRRIKQCLVKNAKRVVFLSGSPLLNRPADLWTILQAVYPEAMGDFYQYAYRYCGAYQGPFGLDVSGATNLPELKQYLDQFVIRYTKEQCLDLPGVAYSTISLEKNKEVERLQSLEKDLGIDVENLLNEGVAIGEYATLRRELGILKQDIAREFIKNIVDQGEDVVVFTYHKEIARILSADAITGETPVSGRQQIVNDFQENGGVIVGTYGAMGTGFTLTRACNVVLVELDYSPLLIQQAVDRLNRIGQKRMVSAHVLLWQDGLEMALWKLLKKKQATFTTLFGE